MVLLFRSHVDALKYACDFEEEGKGLVALRCGGQSIWLHDEQNFLFPVIVMRKLAPLDCFRLFSGSIKFDQESLNEIESLLGSVLSQFGSMRIITMEEWVVEIRIMELTAIQRKMLVDRVSRLNQRLIEIAAKIWGSMPVVSAQPSPTHKSLNLFKIGLR